MPLLILLITFFMLPSAGHAQHRYGSSNLQPGSVIRKPIKKIQLYGERSSGTNYFAKLILANFKHVDADLYHFGWKHFPCWYEYPYDEEYYETPLFHYTLEGNEEWLFIVIFRDPYDWLRSIHERPYHTEEMIGIPFSDFIRSPWNATFTIDKDPATREPFETVMHLRTARIINMLQLKDRVKYVYFINYEVVEKHPRKVLSEISTLFNVKLNKEYHPIVTYEGGKGGKRPFKGSHYPAIPPEDLAFINQHLNQEIEESIGYTLKDVVPPK